MLEATLLKPIYITREDSFRGAVVELESLGALFDMMLNKSINVQTKFESKHDILTIRVGDLVDGVMDLFAGRRSGWFVHRPLAHPEKDF